MAQRYYTIPLKSPNFPMLSKNQSRTIIGGLESSKAGDEEIPKIYFCHNMMPTEDGLESVGYLSPIPAITPAITNLSDARVLHSISKQIMYMAWAADGRVYDLEEADLSWNQLADTVPSTISPSFSIEDVTLGTVNGVTFIWYKGVGCFRYNDTTHQLESVILTGISIPDIVGITASSGYLIVYTIDTIAWSSLIDPTDFTPSQITGSGGGLIAGIQGNIHFILPNDLGILVYAHANVIAGTFTGNAQYPFKLREVTSSKGGVSLDLVAHEANSAAQFSYSQAGLQFITSQRAETFLPEVTDFLAGKVFEDFDESTKELSETKLTTTMKKKIKFIAARYIVISYGITSFTHALVYDVVLERLGKLKIDHVDCFEFLKDQTEVSKESIAFLLSTGEVKTLDFSTTSTNSNGVVIFGKMQYTRGRTITLQGVDVENVEDDATLSVTNLAAIDGKTTTKTEGVLRYSVEGLRKYAFKVSAINHSLLLIGKFNLSTLFITYILNGRR